MKKEMSYKDLLIKILEDKEVPKAVEYLGKKYVFNEVEREYIHFKNYNDDYLTDKFKHLTITGMMHEKVFYNEEILDKQEKDYFRAVIKPFRKRVSSIQIVYHLLSERCHVRIGLDSDNDYIHLPFFRKNTMYKNMEMDRKYTLEELGL